MPEASNLFNDSGKGVIELGPNFKWTGKSTQISISTTGDALTFSAANLLSGTSAGLILGNGTAVDLNGYDQVFPNYIYPVKGAIITSARAPATCRVTGYFNTSGNICAATLNGHVSLDLDTSNANVHQISNSVGAASMTDGSVIVSKGTLKALKNWNMPNIRSLVVGKDGSSSAAKLNISSADVTLNPSLTFYRKGVGRLELVDGLTLKVAYAYGADGQPLAVGKHARIASTGVSACDWIDGDGVLEVCCAGIQPGDFVWCGPAKGGSWLTVANWEVDGQPAPRFPGSGDRAVITGGVQLEVADFEAEYVNALAGLLLLEVDSVLTVKNMASEVAFAFPITGCGQLRGVDVGYNGTTTLAKQVVLSGDNTGFLGSFYFTNTTVKVRNTKALGNENKVVFWGQPAYGGVPAPSLTYEVSGEFHNALWLENGGSSGVLTVKSGCGVTNWGNVYFHGNVMVRLSPSGYFAMGGGIYDRSSITGKAGDGQSLLLNGNCAVIGSSPAIDITRWIYADNGTHYWERPITSMSTKSISFAGKASATKPSLTFGAANIIANPSSWTLNISPTYNPVWYELNGYDQTFKNMSYSSLNNNKELIISSTRAPATLTLLDDSSSQVPYIKFNGAISVAMDSANASALLAISNRLTEVSNTTGGMLAKGGTIQFNNRTKLPNLTKLQAGKTGSQVVGCLKFNGTDIAVNRNVDLEFFGAGKIDLANGYRLVVKHAYVDGKEVPGGVYTASSTGSLANRITGEGSLLVRGGMVLILK